MHRSRFFFLIAANIGIIATFLPWEKISVLGVESESHAGTQIAESILGTKGVGWISLFLFAIAVIICFTGKRVHAINPMKKWILISMGLLTAIIAIHTYIDITQKVILNAAENGGLTFESSAGIGIYMVIAAGIALIILPFLFKNNDQHQVS